MGPKGELPCFPTEQRCSTCQCYDCNQRVAPWMLASRWWPVPRVHRDRFAAGDVVDSKVEPDWIWVRENSRTSPALDDIVGLKRTAAQLAASMAPQPHSTVTDSTLGSYVKVHVTYRDAFPAADVHESSDSQWLWVDRTPENERRLAEAKRSGVPHRCCECGETSTAWHQESPGRYRCQDTVACEARGVKVRQALLPRAPAGNPGTLVVAHQKPIEPAVDCDACRGSAVFCAWCLRRVCAEHRHEGRYHRVDALHRHHSEQGVWCPECWPTVRAHCDRCVADAAYTCADCGCALCASHMQLDSQMFRAHCRDRIRCHDIQAMRLEAMREHVPHQQQLVIVDKTAESKPIEFFEYYCERAPSPGVVRRAGLVCSIRMRQEYERHDRFWRSRLGQHVAVSVPLSWMRWDCETLPLGTGPDCFGGSTVAAEDRGIVHCSLCGGLVRRVAVTQ